jgi:hypothetical protein
MPVTKTAGAAIDMSVLGKEASALGYRGGITLSEDGLTATFLDTDDTALVDQIATAYQTALNERNAIINAFTANQAFLDKTAPTNAESLAQIKALTRQVNGLVKILHRRGLLD